MLIPSRVTTVTMNPSFDRTIILPAFELGKVNRAEREFVEIGGKGVNVSSVLAAGGIKTAATGIMNSDNSGFFKENLRKRGIENSFIYAPGLIRTNLKLVCAGETTDINLPGATVSPHLLLMFSKWLLDVKSEFLVLSGSLPQGCENSFYADFLERFAERNSQKNSRTKSVADCSGEPLKALLRGKIMPFCLKPNKEELAEWAGESLNNVTEILNKALLLQKMGVSLVVISLGSDGALFTAGNAAYHIKITLDKVASSAGAGDAMVAGIIAALLEENIEGNLVTADALLNIGKKASLWAAGKMECEGAFLPAPARLAELAQRLFIERLL